MNSLEEEHKSQNRTKYFYVSLGNNYMLREKEEAINLF